MNQPNKLSAKLSPAQHRDIKARLWAGESNIEIARIYRITDASVSRILHGRQAQSTPWPDGETGAMPSYRFQELRRLRMGLIAVLPDVPERDSLDAHAVGSVSQVTPNPNEVITRPEEETPESAADYRRRKELEEQRTRAVQEAITEMGDAVNEEMEAEVLAEVTAVSDNPRAETPRAAFDPSKMQLKPWDEVLKLAGSTNQFVRLAEQEALVRLACQLAYFTLPPEEWQSVKGLALVKSTYQLLLKQPAAVEYAASLEGGEEE